MTRTQYATTLAVAGAFAAVGSLASAYDVDRGFEWVEWLVRTCAALAAVLLVLGGGHTSRRPRVIAATLVALLFPYCSESIGRSLLPDLALVATVISVTLARANSRTGWMIVSGIAACLACACEASAFMWPIGFTIAAVTSRDTRRAAVGMFAFGGIGLAGGWVYGGAIDVDVVAGGGLAAVHRDLSILLPFVLLGAVGHAIPRSGLPDAGAKASATRHWTTIGLLCLGLVAMGVPLDLRLCVLPILMRIPNAIEELAGLVTKSNTAQRIAAAVGYLSCALLAFLLVPGVSRLLDGPLIAVYLLAG